MHQSSLRSRSGRFLVLLTGCLIAITPAKAQSSSLQDRLDHLIQRLDERRVELHIPGMAIAVMLDGEMVLAHGFGLADVESGRAVTPETIFAIGSSTKAFTSTLVGMMIDDGKMQWDDPMTSFVPLFDLQVDSDDPDAVVTVRDALSHRSGFARMGVLWAAGTSSADMIFKTASKAEPVAPFRKKFYYNNVMYLAAGTAAARTGDTDWDTMVRERLLEPLGMNDSNTSVTEAMSDPRLSLGYIWNETRENFKRLPMRHLDAIGPAGSINSNVLDMAHWVQFQLDRGVYQGNRLISEERHQDTWTTQIDLAPSIGYGLGWFLQEWEGQPVVEHGGNIDGFGAQVALLPESNLGYVLLTNVTATPLQQGSMKIVWETMLGDLPDETQLVEAGDYQEFLGEYVANFASFKDDRFNVLVQNDKLAVDVPGQMIYELEMPDEEGKRYFSNTDQIAVSFERDDEDRVVGMTMYQAGFEFELPREGVETKSEIDESELQRYLGRYHFDQMNADTEVLIQNHRLAIDVPGQMVFELHPPDEEGKWAFRIQDRIKIRFNEDEEGRVESLTFFEGEMNYEMPRVADPEESSLPTLDQLHALRKSDERQAWLQKAGGIHITATVRLVNAGVEGTIEIKCQGTDQYSMHTDLSPFGFDYVAYDGHRGWTQSSFTPDEELEGKQLAQVRMGNPTAFLGALGNLYDSVRIVGVEEFEGREVIRVKLGRGELPDETAFFDAENGDLLKVNSSMIVIGTITMSVVVLFEDYREIDGLRMPFRFISSSEANGKTIMQFEQLKTGLEFDDETFVVELVESGIPTP